MCLSLVFPREQTLHSDIAAPNRNNSFFPIFMRRLEKTKKNSRKQDSEDVGGLGLNGPLNCYLQGVPMLLDNISNGRQWCCIPRWSEENVWDLDNIACRILFPWLHSFLKERNRNKSTDFSKDKGNKERENQARQSIANPLKAQGSEKSWWFEV